MPLSGRRQPGLGFGVWGLGFRKSFKFRVPGSGKASSLGFGVQEKLQVEGSGFRKSFKFRVRGSGKASS